MALGEQIINFAKIGIINNLSNPALGEESVNFTKIGIINNLRYSSSCYSGRFSNLFLGPSESAQSEDNCVSACFLPGTDISDPCVDGLM